MNKPKRSDYNKYHFNDILYWDLSEIVKYINDIEDYCNKIEEKNDELNKAVNKLITKVVFGCPTRERMKDDCLNIGEDKCFDCWKGWYVNNE